MKKKDEKIDLLEGIRPVFKIITVTIPIIGLSPLIVHNWDEKSKREMREKDSGIKKPRANKYEPRDPEKEYLGAKHISSLGWEGFPAVGFKSAILRGAKNLDYVMTDMRSQLFVIADDPVTQLVKINGESVMREDMVKIGMGTAQLRYRPVYNKWSADLTIKFMANKLNLDTIEQLIIAGGMCAGIGEWRNEKDGNFGWFGIEEELYMQRKKEPDFLKSA